MNVLSVKLTTAPFKCGEKIRTQSYHISLIVLIQNEGSSNVDYKLEKYVEDNNGPVVSPTVAGLIGGAIGAVSVLLIVLGIYIYKKYADKKLAAMLKEDTTHQALV